MKLSSLLSILVVLSATTSFANVDHREFEFNDKTCEYNCALTIADAETQEILSYKLHRTSYDVNSYSVNPPGNGSEILVEESSRQGLVNSYQLFSPQKSLLQKKKPLEAKMQIYRREGQIYNSGLGNTIASVEKDTLLGDISVKGTAAVSKKIDKYDVTLKCVQNPKKK